MGTTGDKLQKILDTKSAIKDAIISKGVDVSDTDTFASYADKINNISSNASMFPCYDSNEYKTINNKLYRKILDEHFSDNELNRNIWTNHFLVSRVEKRYRDYSNLIIEDSNLKILTRPQDLERGGAGGDVVAMGIQSAEINGLHLESPIYHDINPFFGFISQEGYYEIRAKVFKGAGTHCAWWMIGTQNTPEEKYEYDIFETHNNSSDGNHIIRHGGIKWNDQNATAEFNTTYNSGLDLSLDYHVYGFEYSNDDTAVYFYLDGELYDTLNMINPTYPLITLFTTHKRINGSSGWQGTADPNLGDIEFDIDYFRVYKKADRQVDIPTIISQENINVKITGTSAISINDDYGILNDMPIYCYLNWSDGSRTEHWVKWEIYDHDKQEKVSNKTDFDWYGRVYGLNYEVKANISFGAIAISGLSIPSTAILYKNAQTTITPSFTPANTTQTNVNWQSSDPNIATVDNGVITYVGEGECTITCTSTDNPTISSVCTVTCRAIDMLSVNSISSKGAYFNDSGAESNSNSNTYNIYDYFYVESSNEITIRYQGVDSSNLTTVRVCEYDTNKNFIQRQFTSSYDNKNGYSITLNNNTKYIRLSIEFNTTTTYSASDFCFSIPGVSYPSTSSNYLLFEVGNISTTGKNDDAENRRIRSDYISFTDDRITVINNTPIECYAFRCYDSNKNFVDSILSSSGMFTGSANNVAVPTGTAYIRIIASYYVSRTMTNDDITGNYIINGITYNLTT